MAGLIPPQVCDGMVFFFAPGAHCTPGRLVTIHRDLQKEEGKGERR
jgi:hypothetical protein